MCSFSFFFFGCYPNFANVKKKYLALTLTSPEKQGLASQGSQRGARFLSGYPNTHVQFSLIHYCICEKYSRVEIESGTKRSKMKEEVPPKCTKVQLLSLEVKSRSDEIIWKKVSL